MQPIKPGITREIPCVSEWPWSRRSPEGAPTKVAIYPGGPHPLDGALDGAPPQPPMCLP